MIDPALLNELGWSKELIDEVTRLAAQVSESAVEAPDYPWVPNAIAASTIVVTTIEAGTSVALYGPKRR